MTDSMRHHMIEWIRTELVGPQRKQIVKDSQLAEFDFEKHFNDPIKYQRNKEPRRRTSPLYWQPGKGSEDFQEVLYFERESPFSRYGCGLLYPPEPVVGGDVDDSSDKGTVGIEDPDGEYNDEATNSAPQSSYRPDESTLDEFDLNGIDIRHPSTMSLSVCISLGQQGVLRVRLPRMRRYNWQEENAPEFLMNGFYEQCNRQYHLDGEERKDKIWRRHQLSEHDLEVCYSAMEFKNEKVLRKRVTPEDHPIHLRLDVFPRRISNNKSPDLWLVTVALRNLTNVEGKNDIQKKEMTLSQSYFELLVEEGNFEPYPESQRPLEQLDDDEKSLRLLYSQSASWGIGHGCAACWDTEPGDIPAFIYAEVMPAVETPSMTPDVRDSGGNLLSLSMRELAELVPDQSNTGWKALNKLIQEYETWIGNQRKRLPDLRTELRETAQRHLHECDLTLVRMRAGLEKLEKDESVLQAFRLANLAMLLQQIATKKFSKRSLVRVGEGRSATIDVSGESLSPWEVYRNHSEGEKLGRWRAFQIAFFLMSINGIVDEHSNDRELVDLIWFPTGGGKTEAYLAVMSFYMFHQRLIIPFDGYGKLERDGTNILIRYTLRMLTTQQFQRAASLICAMEYLRRNASVHDIVEIPGGRFSLGLWVGNTATPGKVEEARSQLTLFRKGNLKGNPLVLTECPWCRAEIGRYNGTRPKGVSFRIWENQIVRGINDVEDEGPLLHCSDSHCSFGAEHQNKWLPIEVIDERIYRHPTSIVIGTVDKFAMLAYRPDAGAIFGRDRDETGVPLQRYMPPGLIIQDELHLISGPLGTMYGFYETVFERLCSFRENEEEKIKPKIIASTATIRGASEQVRAIYARQDVKLFPSPGLDMGDSFFGKYARREDGKLDQGRLYLGIYATEYGSFFTAQVRAFASTLYSVWGLPEEFRDPWWTLLAFYNSLRELGGAKTLFDSDIRSRLKFLFNREGYGAERRHLKPVDELTSRLSQAQIVDMMEKLSQSVESQDVLDACLASNIIEVGVDIDRLSLLAVVGQPKTTAQYIQITGRVGRRWNERPGLVLMMYSPGKSRDRSHFEQFSSYHRRLYERVEPTSATPFAVSAINRALPGAVLAWSRQFGNAGVHEFYEYEMHLMCIRELLVERCNIVHFSEEGNRDQALKDIDTCIELLTKRWLEHPQYWEHFPPNTDDHYLMLWPGQFYTRLQKRQGVPVASSMRQVDGSAELKITAEYILQGE